MASVLYIVAAILLVASLFVFGGGDTMAQIVGGALTACLGLILAALGAILKQLERRGGKEL